MSGQKSIGDALSCGEWLPSIVDMDYEVRDQLKIAADIVLDASLIDGALLNGLFDTMTARDADIVIPDDVTLRSIRELRYLFRPENTRQQIFDHLLAHWELGREKQAQGGKGRQKEGQDR